MKKIISKHLFTIILTILLVGGVNAVRVVQKNISLKTYSFNLPSVSVPSFKRVENKTVKLVRKKNKMRPFMAFDSNLVVFKDIVKPKSNLKYILKNSKRNPNVIKVKLVNKQGHSLNTRVDIRERKYELNDFKVASTTRYFNNYLIVMSELKKKEVLVAINSVSKSIDSITKPTPSQNPKVAQKELVNIVDKVSSQKSIQVKKQKDTINTDDIVMYDYSKDKITDKTTGKVTKEVIDEVVVKKQLRPKPKTLEATAALTLSAMKKTIQDPIKKNPFFDFSKLKESSNKDSKSISTAIAAVTSSSPYSQKAGHSPKTDYSTKIDYSSKTDYSLKAKSKVKAKSKNVILKKPRQAPSQTYKSTLVIKADAITINGQVKRSIKQFEITYLDDYRALSQDYGNGKVVLKAKLNSTIAMREVLLKDFGMKNYATRTELVYENDKIAVNLPLINKESIYALIDKDNVFDAHVLVELDKDTEDVELDQIKNRNSYFKKYFLNEKYHVVDRENSDYSHVLFVGVVPGNRVASYKRTDDVETSKIFFVDEEEIYFDSNFYKVDAVEEFKLVEMDLLGNKSYAKEVDSDSVRFMLNDMPSKKKNLNTHVFTNLVYPLSSRKYFEMKSSNDSIFIGKLNQKTVSVPSENFISEIISRFDVDNLNGQCIVQLNLSKAVKEVNFDGVQEKYNIKLDSFALDKTGEIFDTPDAGTKFLFIKGEVGSNNGVIAVKVKYFDNSTDYLKTFCSNNTYLVEHL
jgi:hypothetical protein